MSFLIDSGMFMDYIEEAAVRISESRDYVTGLDAETGDGDHWVNINMGFEALTAAAPQLRELPIDQVFKKIGMLMMSKIGGSSGILYGGAYIAASKVCAGKTALDTAELCEALEAMVKDMMARGKCEPGFKTMIDSLYPAVETYKSCMERQLSDAELLEAVKKAAVDGAEATRGMEAVKGRASYRNDKGVGHLDPGAVTMSYQLACLCDHLLGVTV